MVDQQQRWQRLRLPALGVMFVSGIYKFLKDNLYLVAGAGFGVAFLDRFGLTELLGLFVLGVLGFGLYALASYWRFRFTYNEDHIRLRQGLLHQTEVRVAFERVQSVEVVKPFYFRPFGLVVLSLQTPGQAKPEVVLAGISQVLASRLRGLMGHDVEASGAHPPLIAVPPGRLFKAGLSSQLVWVVGGGLAYLGGQALERLNKAVEQGHWLDGLSESVLASPAVMVGVVVALILLVFISTGLYTLLVHWGSCLWVHPEKLINQRGALSTRLIELQRSKITGLLVTQSPLGRLFGVWTAMIHQTSSEDVLSEGRGQETFRLLGLVPSEIASLAQPILKAHWPSQFNSISPRYRRLWRSRWLVCLVCLGAALWVFDGLVSPSGDYWPWAAALLLGVLAVWMWFLVAIRYQRWGWRLEKNHLWVRSGLLGTRIQGVELGRIQQIRVIRSPYQIRHDLSSLVLVLPQGEINLPFLPLDQAQKLANTVAWLIER
ncbi:MAG TPA: PH domain-containing protein [Wenzhouxiangella sp.]